MNVLELFCGIGGCSTAVGAQATITAAIDVSTLAVSVYRANFPHPVRVANLEAIDRETLRQAQAALWWLSPPCQPYTRRGLRGDIDDPRSHPLLALLDPIARIRPTYLALENVPGFEVSETHARLCRTLSQAGYRIEQLLLCPTELGVPMRRRRFYLLAVQGDAPIRTRTAAAEGSFPLATYLEATADDDNGLLVDVSLLDQYRGALGIVDRDDAEAICACFTSAYGRSPVRSGSYLRRADGQVRRFHPREILSLLGFPESYQLPDGIDHRRAWRLIGNSVSVDAVRWWLSAVPFS